MFVYLLHAKFAALWEENCVGVSSPTTSQGYCDSGSFSMFAVDGEITRKKNRWKMSAANKLN